MKLIVACLLALSVLADPKVGPTYAGPTSIKETYVARTFRSANTDAVFAGGCFWCLEEAMEKVPGVLAAVSGYTGGTIKNPSYEQVSTGGTGHVEAVRVTYDPAKVTYAQLVEAFWHNIDPLDGGGQFCDRGEQYRAAIFVKNAEERSVAEQSKRAIEASGKLKQPIVTAIHSAAPFYEAEEYHQDYYKKNPVRYRFYKFSCGRANRLEAIWGSTK
jgi:peptide-methionine (S)-S-oxide reductase